MKGRRHLNHFFSKIFNILWAAAENAQNWSFLSTIPVLLVISQMMYSTADEAPGMLTKNYTQRFLTLLLQRRKNIDSPNRKMNRFTEESSSAAVG
jgi:hypothetical protein